MRKVLILANNDIGLYKFRKELIIELLKENIVYISLPYGEFVDKLIELGCIFINTPLDRRTVNPLTDLKLFINYQKIFNDVRPELVITYTIKPNIYGGMISRIKKIKYVANITGLGTTFQKANLLKYIVVTLYKVSLKHCKTIFFENESNKEEFIKYKISKAENSITLNGAGVNLDEYPYTKYPDEKQDTRFLFVGRIMREKGIDELLNVAKLIKDEYQNIQFDIVGPIEDNYIEILKEYQSKKLINYYGYQSDVRPYIARCHCFLLPSYHEGMANTLLEAGAIGRPLITTNIPGCKETVKINFNGYLANPKDLDSFKECIINFLNLEYEEKLNMSINSHKTIKDSFDRKDIIRKTILEINNRS